MKQKAPHIENSVLLALLESKDVDVRALILKQLTVDDFGTDWGREVFERILLLRSLNKPIGGVLDVAEDPAISEEARTWLRSTPKNRRVARTISLDKIEYRVEVLHQHSKIRVLSKGVDDIIKVAEGKQLTPDMERSIIKSLETMHNAMHRTSEAQPFLHLGKRASIPEVKSLTEELLDPEQVHFIPTGFSAIDEHMHGFEPGTLVVLSGPPAGGKSLVANTMAINQYKISKCDVCVVSLEMNKKQQLRRMIANLTQFNHNLVRDPSKLRETQIAHIKQEMRRFVQWGKKRDCEFTIRDVANTDYTPTKLENELAQFHYDVIYVDYITLLSTKEHKTLWEMQMEFSRQLRVIAQKLNCVMVVLTQLSDDEKVKYGRAIEENADYWFWWNWDAQSREYGETDILLQKARHAEGFTKFRTHFKFAEMRVTVYGKNEAGFVPDNLRMKKGMASGPTAGGF